jgi:hypothetical protein
MPSPRPPVLAHFDPAELIHLEIDALEFAIAGIIVKQQDEIRSSAEDAMRSERN